MFNIPKFCLARDTSCRPTRESRPVQAERALTSPSRFGNRSSVGRRAYVDEGQGTGKSSLRKWPGIFSLLLLSCVSVSRAARPARRRRVATWGDTDRPASVRPGLPCSAAARRLSLGNLVASFLYMLLPLRLGVTHRYPRCPRSVVVRLTIRAAQASGAAPPSIVTRRGPISSRSEFINSFFIESLFLFHNVQCETCVFFFFFFFSKEGERSDTWL